MGANHQDFLIATAKAINEHLRANQSLKLTAEAGVVSRYAQENEFIVANAQRMEIEFRIVR